MILGARVYLLARFNLAPPDRSWTENIMAALH